MSNTTIESHEAHVEIDEGSYATVFDIAEAREKGCYSAEPTCRPLPVLDELDYADDDVDDPNRIHPGLLQPSTPGQRHGGGRSSSKRKHETVKPMTAQERMDKRCALIAATAPEAYLQETENQRAERHLLEARRRIERQDNKGGRPRKGAEVSKSYGVRLEPQLADRIKSETGMGLRDWIESSVEQLLPLLPPTQAVAA